MAISSSRVLIEASHRHTLRNKDGKVLISQNIGPGM